MSTITTVSVNAQPQGNHQGVNTHSENRLRVATNWLRRKQNWNTYRTYRSSVKQFRIWLMKQGLTLTNWTAADVVLYIRFLLEGRSANGTGTAAVTTITGAVAALRNHFRYNNEKTLQLNHRLVADALQVAKRDGKKAVKKLPLTVRMLQCMYDWYVGRSGRTAEQSWLECRDLCMIILMMSAFLRESEVTALRQQDVKVCTVTLDGKSREILEITVQKAKNDQAGKGHLIRVGDQDTNCNICPVFWVKLYRQRSKALYSDNRPPLRFFHTYDCYSLMSTTPCGIVQKWVKRINSTHNNEFGDPKKYGSHSCRIGGVTAAHESGVDMTLVQQHGGWKSDVVYDYIQPSQQQQLQVTQFLSTE